MDKNFLNIPSYIEDPSYRYKMPKMILKIEGKGNGIKTNIVNMQEVSKALRVPTEYPLKFMGFELGSQIIYKEKGNDVTTIINGAFKEDILQKQLDKFIQKYVLCPKCTYPEFVLRVRQGLVSGKCDSCGERAKCDNAHKFAAYIVKNPPKTKGINKEEEDDKKDKKVAATVPSTTVTKPVKEEKDVNLNIKKLEASDLTLVSEELAKKIQLLTESINSQKQENGEFTETDISQTNIVKEIKDMNIQKGLESQVAHILFQSLFSVNIAHEVQNNAEVLSKTFSKLKIPNPELETIMNISYLLFKTYNEKQDFTPYVPTILKYFYDADLLSEDFLKNYAESKINLSEHYLYDAERIKKFAEAAQPFLDWILNAEEDEDEEGEEEEGEEKKEESQ
ncbi:domain found in IF2B/IF5 protein (macronuclear) [Tetrahymena thermophila SB210]|uniref:Domain found in IF2B/IF5 protein n=1 Tax=Tetrahymena thermophila (strain SB210) TaxID=312017 RepID=I7ML76_TETTS|nr:domain found in IF2B/IF5 protein [Tetrahymena thermophila SB210]EAS01319.2 domain found in IF2B/IF5 protein [Tetrahymena thermophila SB210]|eukprot:XP_001021564.2 domain found in IF2B/IF5 protein [Tetrahymena thermophila SB210]